MVGGILAQEIVKVNSPRGTDGSQTPPHTHPTRTLLPPPGSSWSPRPFPSFPFPARPLGAPHTASECLPGAGQGAVCRPQLGRPLTCLVRRRSARYQAARRAEQRVPSRSPLNGRPLLRPGEGTASPFPRCPSPRPRRRFSEKEGNRCPWPMPAACGVSGRRHWLSPKGAGHLNWGHVTCHWRSVLSFF